MRSQQPWYLQNDLEDALGRTHFPRLQETVQNRPGRCLAGDRRQPKRRKLLPPVRTRTSLWTSHQSCRRSPHKLSWTHSTSTPMAPPLHHRSVAVAVPAGARTRLRSCASEQRCPPGRPLVWHFLCRCPQTRSSRHPPRSVHAGGHARAPRRRPSFLRPTRSTTWSH